MRGREILSENRELDSPLGMASVKNLSTIQGQVSDHKHIQTMYTAYHTLTTAILHP